MKTSIIVDRLRVIPVSEPNHPNTPMKRLTFLAELAKLGYTVSNTAIWNDSVLENYQELIAKLREMRGADVEYVPLFLGFPEKCPDEREYQAKRLISILMGVISEEIKEESGYRFPNNLESMLFNPEEFGALPVSQRQDERLYKLGVEKQKQREEDSHIEWIKLKLVDNSTADEMLKEWVLQNIYARSSIKEELRGDITWVINYFALQEKPILIDPNNIKFKENQTFLSKFYWEKSLYDLGVSCLSTPTDCLRLLASLTESDVSLSTPITFPKLNRPQRRAIASVLERSPNLAEDLKRYRGLWLAVGEYLHPRELEKKYPKTALAFHRLRNQKIYTFESYLEPALEKKDLPEAIKLLSSRPGLFARRLHQLLEIAQSQRQTELVLQEFTQVADKIPLKNLLVMQKYFATIHESEWRAIVNKKGQLRVLDNKPQRTSPEVNTRVVEILQRVIVSQINKNKETWQDQKIWVNPTLNKYVLPLSERKASKGTLSLARGSRIPIEVQPVLRLFVYWHEAKQTTDLDLSVEILDDKFQGVGHVSYTQLNNQGMTHSGDIQSAPHGASEFIDVQLKEIKPEWRYLAVMVFRFAGDAFDEMTCHCGWMLRNSFKSDSKTFDAKTVQSKIDLNGKGSYSIPIIVDLENREIIYTDLYVSGSDEFNRVEEAGKNISMICEQVAQFYHNHPTFSDLAIAHILARNGTQVESIEEADITFGLEDCTYSVQEPAKILSELLC